MSSNPSLPIDSSSLIQPDVDILRKSVKNILRGFANLKTTYAASLQEKSERLKTYLQDFDSELKNSLVILKTKIENEQLSSTLSTLEELQTALTDPDLSEEDKTEITQEVVSVKKNINTRLKDLKSSFDVKIDSLVAKLANVKQVVLQERIQEFNDLKLQQKADCETKSLGLSQQKTKLISERDQLIKSLDVMRKRDIFKTFSEYIPDEKDIDALDLAKPEIALIKQGVALYKKMIGNISEGLEYAKFADAKNELDRQIEVISLKIQENNQDLTQINNELEDVAIIANIGSERNKYVTEAEKVITSLTLFSNNLDSLSKIERYSEINQLFKDMVSYLTTLLSEYGKPI